ncbi:MAG: right-handed parallel beta-helix repeat-containing protein [Planctomycetota bacterium]
MKLNLNSFCTVAAFLIPNSAVFATDRLVPSVYPTIQAGIDAAVNGDTVIVAQGTYYENTDFGGKSITLRSTDPNDPNVVAGTVIDANSSGTVVTFPDIPSANCELAGFTITGGNSLTHGGGICCWDGTLDITNCLITGNSASDGGGIFNEHGALTLAGCTFIANVAREVHGGGLLNLFGNVMLTDCTFTENVSVNWSGGGIRSTQGALTLTDCTFAGNSASQEGGGVATDYNSVTLTNCKFNGNSAGIGGAMVSSHFGATATDCTFSGNSAVLGGAILTSGLYLGDLTLNNCTFSGNVADDWGGAVYNWQGGNLVLTNCILWGNTAYEGPQIAVQQDWTLSISYSCLQGGQLDIYTGDEGTLNWGNGNIDADPCFADDPGGDCHLQSTAGRWDADANAWIVDDSNSPCIDAGNPGCPPANEPPPNGNRINMGAYGGTAEASKSPPDWALLADLTNDRAVDYADLSVFVDYWLEAGQCVCADLSHDQSANFLDFAIFADNWAWEQ